MQLLKVMRDNRSTKEVYFQCPCCGDIYHRESPLWQRVESVPGWTRARSSSVCIFCAREKKKPIKPWDIIGTRFGFPLRCYYNWGRLVATCKGKEKEP